MPQDGLHAARFRRARDAPAVRVRIHGRNRPGRATIPSESTVAGRKRFRSWVALNPARVRRER